MNFSVGIGQDRLFDLRVETRELHLEVFLGQDVLAEGARLLGDPVQQVRVHIRADAETEDARAPALACFTSRQNLRPSSVVPMVGRPSVRKITTKGRSPRWSPGNREAPVCRGMRPSALLEGARQWRCRPMRFEVLDELLRPGAVRLVRLDQFVEERLDLGREADDLEAVAVVEVLDAELEGFLGLLAVSCRPWSRRCPARRPRPWARPVLSSTSTPGEASSRK